MINISDTYCHLYHRINLRESMVTKKTTATYELSKFRCMLKTFFHSSTAPLSTKFIQDALSCSYLLLWITIVLKRVSLGPSASIWFRWITWKKQQAYKKVTIYSSPLQLMTLANLRLFFTSYLTEFPLNPFTWPIIALNLLPSGHIESLILISYGFVTLTNMSPH